MEGWVGEVRRGDGGGKEGVEEARKGWGARWGGKEGVIRQGGGGGGEKGVGGGGEEGVGR